MKVYVLSTGRTATTLLARVLTTALDSTVSHQIPGSRAANLLGNLVDAKLISAERGLSLAKRALGGRLEEATTDPLRSMIVLSQLRRVGRSSDSRVVHVVRDPRDFASSFMNWKASRPRRLFLHHAVPLWQPSPLFARDLGWARALRMRKFERFCWVWKRKNEAFEMLSDRHLYLRVRMEDALASDGDGLEELFDFIGAKSQGSEVSEMLERVLNAPSSNHFPQWKLWDGSRARLLDRHCRTLMNRYGYGGEAEWDEKVGIVPSKVTCSGAPPAGGH